MLLASDVKWGPGGPGPLAELVVRPQYGWSLLALHEHIVSRLSVSATNSTGVPREIDAGGKKRLGLS
jgi:hypothetical protein